MPKYTAVWNQRGLLAGLIVAFCMIPNIAMGAESYVEVATSIQCNSVTHEALGGMEGNLRSGEAFGIPKDDWSDLVAEGFKKRIQACDESNHSPDPSFSLSYHFELIWDELGSKLKEERASDEREIEYAKQARQRQIAQEARDKKAADEEAERDRQQADAARVEAELAQQQAAREREAKIEAARQAEINRIDEEARDKQAAEDNAEAVRRLEAAEQAERAAYDEETRKAAATRMSNPACVRADDIRKDIDKRSGGDVANLLGAIVMASQAGNASTACELANGLSRDLDSLSAASAGCDTAESAQIGGMQNSLYTMRQEINCLGWFE